MKNFCYVKITTIVGLLLLSVLMLMGSCIQDAIKAVKPSGDLVQNNRNLVGFKSMSVCCGFKVSLTMGDAEEVKVEAAESLLPYIETFVKEGELIIRNKTGYRFNFKNDADRPHIYVSAKIMNEIEGSGGVVITSTGKIQANKFDLDLSGGSSFIGNLEVVDMDCGLSGGATVTGEIKATKLDFDMSGGAELDLKGSADKMDVECSGGGIISAYDFVTNKLDVSLSGGSIVKISVNKELNIGASGGSGLYYKGSGTVHTRNLSGGSWVKHVE